MFSAPLFSEVLGYRHKTLFDVVCCWDFLGAKLIKSLVLSVKNKTFFFAHGGVLPNFFSFAG